MSASLIEHFDLLATAPGGVARLRELILTLAVQGKLVPQNPDDEPASVLLQRIQAEKQQLIEEKRIRRSKPLDAIQSREMPYELPGSWVWERLGNLGDWGAGATPSRSNAAYYGGEIPWFKSGELTSDFISDSEETVTESALRDCSLRLNQPGDVLIAMYGATIGKTAILSVVATTNQAVCACTPFGGLRNAYLLLLLKALKPYFIGLGAGGAQPNISREKIISTVVGLPPLEEQSRIVARVEELMRLCDALEAKGKLDAVQHAQLLRTLLGTLTDSASPAELAANWQRVAEHFDLLLDRPEAIDALEQTLLQLAVRGLLVPQDPSDEPASVLLQKIRAEKDRLIAEGKIKRDKPLPPITEEEKPFELPVGWEWVRLNDLIRIGSGDGLTAAQMSPGGTVPVYGGNGVNGYHDQANVEEPTLVIGRVGYYCGSVHVTPKRAWVTDNAFITRYPKTFLDMRWLYWLLVGTNLKENDSATAQPVISGRKLYPIVVALPPLAEQSRIVARVAELRQFCSDLRQRLTASRTAQGHLAQALVDAAGAA